MLEAEDLFKSAWVWFKTNNKPVQITENYMLLDGSGKRMVSLNANGERYCVPIEEVEPIVIDVDFLFKNNFISFDNKKTLLKDPEIYIYDEDGFSIEIQWRDKYDVGEAENREHWDEYWRLEIDGPGGHFETTRDKIFVHELQYALRLCKFKKKIVVW